MTLTTPVRTHLDDDPIPQPVVETPNRLLILDAGADPQTPGEGQIAIYFRSDNTMVYKDRQGIEHLIGREASTSLVTQAPIRVSGYGDSIASYGGTPHDKRYVDSGAPVESNNRLGAHLIIVSEGKIRLVANNGVSGETTTQMVAREPSSYPESVSTTRRALIDAHNLGVQCLVWSAGINDLMAGSYTGVYATDEATLDGIVSTAISNITILATKAVEFGMVNIFPTLLGFTNNAAGNDSEIRIAAIRRGVIKLDGALQSLISDNPELGYFVDCRDITQEADGAIKSGLYGDGGLHPSVGCEMLRAERIAKQILSVFGINKHKFAYPIPRNGWNNYGLYLNSNGLATGIARAFSQGSGSFTNSISIIDGMRTQRIIATCTATNGGSPDYAQCDITITLPVFGATPNLSITTGDYYVGECDIHIHDGNGDPVDGVYNFGGRFGLTHSGIGTYYHIMPNYNTSEVQKNLQKAPKGKLAFRPIKAAANSANCTNSVINVVVYIYKSCRVYIDISNIRCGLINSAII